MGRTQFIVTFVVLGLLLLSTFDTSPTWSAFTATTTNTGTTFSAAASFPTYSASVTADAPWGYYRGEESGTSAATLVATDTSGHSYTGGYDGVTNGPTTFWKFEENTGSTAGDSSGAVNTGTLTNTPTWTTGTVGNALSFDGTNQYVEGTRAAVKNNTSFSVSAWVNLTTTTVGTYRTAVSQNGTNIPGFWLQQSSNGKWVFAMGDQDSTGATLFTADSASAPTQNTWYHLVGVYNSAAAKLYLYVNGTLQADQPSYSTPWTTSASGVLAAGRAMWSGFNGDYWPGMIDEVRLYQRALSAAEISALYNKANALPVLDWEFNEGAGTTTADLGSNAQTGTLGGTAAWTASGHNSNALTYGGASYVTATGPAVTTNTTFSVSAWANLGTKGQNRTVVSQDGTNISGFYLQFDSAADRWALTMRSVDADASTAYQAKSTSAPTLGTWYHLVGVYDSVAAQIKLYVDGSLEATTAMPSPWVTSSLGSLTVGRARFSASARDYFSGYIDSVQLFQRSLSAAAVSNLYNGVAYTEADMTAGLPGALQGAQQGQQSTTAVAFTGHGNGYSTTSLNNPTTFTIECWFRTTSTTGGLLVGFGDAKIGANTSFDRHIYLDSGNKLTFGTYTGAYKTLRTTATYNDGAWHQVAASLGAAGQKLYVDGALVDSDATTTTAQNYTGYWRWGGGTLTAWPNVPTTGYFTGTIDEVAAYSSQLTDQQIARHYAANH